MKRNRDRIFVGVMLAAAVIAFIMAIVEGIQVARVIGILITDAAELGLL